MNEIIETTRPSLMELLHRKSELECSIKGYKKAKDKPAVRILRRQLYLIEIQIKYEAKNDKQK